MLPIASGKLYELHFGVWGIVYLHAKQARFLYHAARLCCSLVRCLQGVMGDRDRCFLGRAPSSGLGPSQFPPLGIFLAWKLIHCNQISVLSGSRTSSSHRAQTH